MMSEPGAVGDFAEQHAAAFNAAVMAGDFAGFLDGFTDDAVIRFENVPGAGSLEYSGRPHMKLPMPSARRMTNSTLRAW